MKHQLISAAFLMVAVVCYVIGSNVTLLFVAAGLVLESVFWFRVFKRPRSSSNQTDSKRATR